jgi:hypothetical protein
MAEPDDAVPVSDVPVSRVREPDEEASAVAVAEAVTLGRTPPGMR